MNRKLLVCAALSQMVVAANAFADIAPRNVNGCIGKNAGDTCEMESGALGRCVERTRYRYLPPVRQGQEPRKIPSTRIICEEMTDESVGSAASALETDAGAEIPDSATTGADATTGTDAGPGAGATSTTSSNDTAGSGDSGCSVSGVGVSKAFGAWLLAAIVPFALTRIRRKK